MFYGRNPPYISEFVKNKSKWNGKRCALYKAVNYFYKTAPS